MGKLDHNLDAYRLAATALERLRALIRRHLHATHGPDWETAALPDDPAQFLAQRRARESSVKWNPSSSTDLLDFAGFCNLYEILNTHQRLREGFARLVPEPQALRLRFLELDTVLNRIAYARPISESDMELLLGFDERLRQLVAELAPDADGPAGDDDAAPPRTGAGRPARQAGRTAAANAAEPALQAPPPAPPAQPPARPPDPVPAAAPPRHAAAPEEHPSEPAPAPSRERPGSARAAAPPAGGRRPAAAATPPPQEELPAVAPRELEAALRRGEDRTVLSSLYQEITALAERLWSDSASARAPMWEMVSESTWYRERFSALRLRVISNFYDLLRAVQDRRAAGASRSELHDFLKERNFAQVLMDLREFFRPYVAPPRHGQAE
jgi:hypothetical protein